jgi:hypothetical protein
MLQWFKDIPKYSKKTDSVRSNVCSSSTRTYRNTPNKCNSTKSNEYDTTREWLDRTQTKEGQLNESNGHSNKPYISAQQKQLMGHLLKIPVWNANGLCQHAQEIKIFIQTFNLVILLVWETHFTNTSYKTIPNYNIYYSNHPDETAQGATEVTIQQNIKHYLTAEYTHENIHATSIATEDSTGETAVSAISQMKHQLDATLCRFYFCRVTLHVSGASDHHQEHLKLVQRPLVHVLSL